MQKLESYSNLLISKQCSRGNLEWSRIKLKLGPKCSNWIQTIQFIMLEIGYVSMLNVSMKNTIYTVYKVYIYKKTILCSNQYVT